MSDTLDSEWVRLVLEAKRLGITLEQIQSFLASKQVIDVPVDK